MSEPLRTCIGCRLRDNPRNMLRIVRFGGDGERMRILPDVHRILPGMVLTEYFAQRKPETTGYE